MKTLVLALLLSIAAIAQTTTVTGTLDLGTTDPITGTCDIQSQTSFSTPGGVRVVAVGDRYGAIRNPRGLDVPGLARHMAAGGLLRDYPGAEPLDPGELLTTACTVLVPAALERVVTGANAGRLRCRVLAEAANGPTTPEADAVLAGSDLFVVPDVLCNAGGVTVSYFEWVQDIQQLMWSEEDVNAKLRQLMLKATGLADVLRQALDDRVSGWRSCSARSLALTKRRTAILILWSSVCSVCASSANCCLAFPKRSVGKLTRTL